VGHEAPNSCRSGYVGDKSVTECSAGELPGQGKVQRPLYLSTQLLSLLLYSSTSVSLSVFGFL
jgi:hypothetical protein